MKKLIIYSLLGMAFTLGACSEEALEPAIDIKPEYEKALELNDQSIHADSLIWNWYKAYDCATLYSFSSQDFSWLWAGKFTNGYTPFDKSKPEDREALNELTDIIAEKFLSKYGADFLKRNLPYKIFLVKELSNTYKSPAESNKLVPALSNNQDAMFISWLDKDGDAYSASKLETEITNVFGTFFYERLTEKPEKFIATRPNLLANLVTIPKDEQMKKDLKKKPDFENDQHNANVCGYIKAYLTTKVKAPDEAQDYSDYFSFITGNPGSEIRKITQFYWRVAMRGTLFIEYYKKVNGEDLIATQNAAFPNDKVTMEDFAYEE